MSVYKRVYVDGRERMAHDVIMEDTFGVSLAEDEVVHHINGDKSDNRPENLQIMKRSEHTALHARGKVFSPETIGKMRKAHTGKLNRTRKLTEAQVHAIVQELQAGRSLRAIGREYGVNDGTIAAIRDGVRYREVTSKIPGIVFPMSDCRKNPANSHRKLNIWELSDIRIRLMNGEGAQTIAKRYGITRMMVVAIRDGRTYADIPWPEELARYPVITDVPKLVDLFLDNPLSRNEDDVLAILQDYRIYPTLQAVLAFRMVKKALAGDTELAMFLFSMGKHAGEISDMIRENSIYYRYFAAPEEPKR